ncbi:hypothetical protein DEQ92_14210 [Haloferax sp. Atlit-6N]|uniref:DUF7096 domain-containing protein n=1 Tax=Haloferax sp. Atlit-6N TaxID=2077205 RepID=UPI000E242540|nr:hypothetical protein [Haloferax sp. Atlit-6N]REA02053.1 hypothetical protein DEQ92_14210 [Haloferax sp. Atlit-6N]
MRSLPIIFAVILLASPVLGVMTPGVETADRGFQQAPVAQTTEQVQSNDTIRVLDLPARQEISSSITTHHVDLGPSLGFSSSAVGAEVKTRAIINRINSTSDVSTRKQYILGEMTKIEQRVIVLQGAQQEAIVAHNEGDLSARELLIRFTEINAEAHALEQRRQALSDAADRTEDFSLGATRLASIKSDLNTLTSPVREHAQAVLTGRADPSQFSIRTSQSAIVMTTIANQTYLREAYRLDLRARDANGLTANEVEGLLMLVGENYPSLLENGTVDTNADIIGAGSSYVVNVNHDRGELAAYVDTGSRKVFKETQRRPLETITYPQRVTRVKDGLQLTVFRSYPGGPVRIQLNESDTETPVDANVTVGVATGRESQYLGRTGADGTLWMLSPSAGYTITVIKGNAAVIVQTTPTDTPEIVQEEQSTESTETTETASLGVSPRISLT